MSLLGACLHSPPVAFIPPATFLSPIQSVQLIYKTLFRISRIAKTHSNAAWLQNFLGVDDDDDALMKSLSYEAAPSDF